LFFEVTASASAVHLAIDKPERVMSCETWLLDVFHECDGTPKGARSDRFSGSSACTHRLRVASRGLLVSCKH
jgi:hypothetical protein